MAASIKVTALIFAVQAMALLFVRGRGDRRQRVLQVVVLVLGLALPLILGAAYLFGSGALPAFLDDYVPYIRVYVRVGAVSLGEMAANLLQWSGEIAPLLGFVVLFFALPAFRRDLPFAMHVLLQGIILGVAAYFLQRKGWQYHLYPFFFFGLVLSAACAGRLIERAMGRGRHLALALFALTCLGWAPWLSAAAVAHVPPRARPDQMREDLRQVLDRGGIERVQVLDTTWGGIEALYRLHVVQATPFIYDWQFFVPMTEPVLERLRQRFLIAFAGHLPGALVITAEAWPLETHGYDRIGTWAAFAQLLAARYDLAIERDGYRIYLAHPADHPKL
jgi:hypothetical protein